MPGTYSPYPSFIPFTTAARQRQVPPSLPFLTPSVPVNPITANATALWKATGAALKTLSVSPVNVGDLMVFATTYSNSTATVPSLTAISGGGCNASGSGLDGAWQRIAGPLQNQAATATLMDIWMGKVITAGASTITITSTAVSTIRLNCKEFGSGGGIGTVWAQDGAGGTQINTSSTTVTFPTLTPTGIDRLYVGFGTNGTGLTTGSTPTGTTVELDPGSNPYLYNPSVANSTQTPTSQQSGAAVSYTVGALITASNPTARFMPFFM